MKSECYIDGQKNKYEVFFVCVVVVAVELVRLHVLFCCGILFFFVLWRPLLMAHSSLHEALYWGHTI
jgi:hypothetical protein